MQSTARYGLWQLRRGIGVGCAKCQQLGRGEVLDTHHTKASKIDRSIRPKSCSILVSATCLTQHKLIVRYFYIP